VTKWVAYHLAIFFCDHIPCRFRDIATYLDIPSVRKMLGVDPSVTANFSSCSLEVNAAFDNTQDMLHPTSEYVAALLERNVRVLIYVGTYDWICNWVGNERWTLALEWSGKEEFVKLPLKDWQVGGKRAGRTRSAEGFTFATVDGAGHMVRRAFFSCIPWAHCPIYRFLMISQRSP
jgi:cathepsin A (carboxypeptidase C)